MYPAQARDRIRRVLEPVVASAGLDLEEVDVRPAGRRRLVRVVVDRDGGVDLDEVALISQAASSALDAADAMGETPYVLEVTSPGVDRPLTEPRHWRRAVGRLVQFAPAGGAPVTGRMVGLEGSVVHLDVGGRDARYEIAELGPGQVQVEFTRALAEPHDRPDREPAGAQREEGARWTST